MTIVSTGDMYPQTQVVRQLNKLYDVIEAVLLEKTTNPICVEHLSHQLKLNGEGQRTHHGSHQYVRWQGS